LERHHKKLKSRLNKFNFSCDKKYELDDEDCFDDFNYKSILLDENNKNLENLNNMNDLINIKTDYFTNNSNLNIKENIYTTQNENIDENTSMDEEKISTLHDKLFFYNNEKDKTLNFESDFYFDKNKNSKKNDNNTNKLKTKKKNNIKEKDNNIDHLKYLENGISNHDNAYNNNLFRGESNSNKNFDNYYNIAKINLANINISSINPQFNQISSQGKRKNSKLKKTSNNPAIQAGKNLLTRNDSFSLPRTNSRMFNKMIK